MNANPKLVESISREFRDYFENGLKFILKDGAYVNEGTQPTINRFDEPVEEVKAKKWYDNIWFFIKIRFIWDDENKKRCYPAISISFFLETANNCLDQLFRAEWDSYKNLSSLQHPQPHWHITPNLAIEKSFEDLRGKDDDDPFKVFAEMVEEDKKNLLKIHLMHFAMGGKWYETGEFINEMTDTGIIINWMKYLFTHIKTEIEYLKKKI